jgi:uncharacterized membrane-anchored protein
MALVRIDRVINNICKEDLPYILEKELTNIVSNTEKEEDIVEILQVEYMCKDILEVINKKSTDRSLYNDVFSIMTRYFPNTSNTLTGSDIK